MTSIQREEICPPEPKLEEVNYLWGEYQYRHQLCWNTVLKISLAVLTLVAIPYVHDDLTAELGYWMLLPTGLAVALAGFGIGVVANELALFAKIKLAYRTVQNRLLDRLLGNPELAFHSSEVLTSTSTRQTPFDRYVTGFMWFLCLLTLVNAILLAAVWIPHVQGLQREMGCS